LNTIKIQVHNSLLQTPHIPNWLPAMGLFHFLVLTVTSRTTVPKQFLIVFSSDYNKIHPAFWV
jgi:hypothetical protein